MNKQYRINQVVDAMQLRWDNWSEMCDWAGVGRGVFSPVGIKSKLNGEDIMTLEIPVPGNQPRYAILSDWIIKAEDGSLHPIPEYLFDVMYSEVEESK